jgi:hypothetical protein
MGFPPPFQQIGAPAFAAVFSLAHQQCMAGRGRPVGEWPEHAGNIGHAYRHPAETAASGDISERRVVGPNSRPDAENAPMCAILRSGLNAI